MTDAVRFEISQGVATLSVDDGKANALSHVLIESLSAGLDRAEREANSVLIVGRPGRLCGGFDLAVMQSGDEGLRELVAAGAELLMRIFSFPRPVVVACTGHAVAAGALILLAADLRIGVKGGFKIGLNEISIGMPLPLFATELASRRLSNKHLIRATLLSELYDPAGAVEAGYLDRIVEPDFLLDQAMSAAQLLANCVDPAFRQTRDRLRGQAVAEILRTLADDLKDISLASTR